VTEVSALLVADKDLMLHVQTVSKIRLPRQLKGERRPLQSSTTINRWPWCLLCEPSNRTMATPLDNFATPWSCVCPPEHRARVSSFSARRMLAKLGELHQSLCPHPTRNPGAARGCTCLDGPCEQGPNVVLEAIVLCREKLEAMLGASMPRRERPEVTSMQQWHGQVPSRAMIARRPSEGHDH
jgi:hypothetical protein